MVDINNIQITERVLNWEESIKKVAKLLLDNGSITEEYVQAMIKNVHDNGPYIVIAPNIALPHSKSELGVIKTDVAILKLNNEVIYPNNKPVKLLICLAAKDSNEHMEVLSKIAEFLMDESKIEVAINTTSLEELREVICGI